MNTELTTTPRLYLRKGRQLAEVTPGQASKAMEILREATGLGASKLPNIKLHDVDGRQIGYVSYNGRVWLGNLGNHVEIPCVS